MSLADVAMLINILHSFAPSLASRWFYGSCRCRNGYKYHQLYQYLTLSSRWFYRPCRCRNASKDHQFSLALSDGFMSLAGVAMLINIINSLYRSLSLLVVLWGLRSRNTYKYHLVLVGLVVLRSTAIRFYTHNPVPVNIHCRDLFVSYRDLCLLAIGLWEYIQVVIFVLVCYLPQLQHHALGALEVRSLTLLGPSSLDQWTLSGGNCTGGWQQLPVAPVPPQAGLPQEPLSQSLHHLWREAPRTAPLQECQGPM